jgi:hypothetical protein
VNLQVFRFFFCAHVLLDRSEPDLQIEFAHVSLHPFSSRSEGILLSNFQAGVAELADALDSKSEKGKSDNWFIFL